MNIDNAAEEYYDFTPYSYVANSPIIASDPTGERIAIVGDDKYRSAVLYQLILGATSEEGFNQLVSAIESKNTFVIQMGDSKEKGNGVGGVFKNGDDPEGDGTFTRFLNFNPFDTETADGVTMTPDEIIVHELDHFNNGGDGIPYYTGKSVNDGNGVEHESFPASEVSAVAAQNRHRSALGKGPRKTYTGNMGTAVNVHNKRYDRKTRKLIPANNSIGKAKPKASILIYLMGTKVETKPPSNKRNVHTNRDTAKGGLIKNMKVRILSGGDVK